MHFRIETELGIGIDISVSYWLHARVYTQLQQQLILILTVTVSVSDGWSSPDAKQYVWSSWARNKGQFHYKSVLLFIWERVNHELLYESVTKRNDRRNVSEHKGCEAILTCGFLVLPFGQPSRSQNTAKLRRDWKPNAFYRVTDTISRTVGNLLERRTFKGLKIINRFTCGLAVP